MCGIAAIFSYTTNSPPVDREELLSVREAMATRGPDDAGLWISDNNRVGLAHRRLAIIDLSETASQPMSIEDGRYRIVYNGEIYNYQALRCKLKKKGYRFRSTSDTEVLLNLYQDKGRAMVHELRGMYAFAIWDEEKRGLFLARDHFGIKPLYIYDDGKTFRCASQVKALLAGGGFEQKTEPAGHVAFFLWGSVPEPYTLYQDVFALPAGHTLWVDDNGPRAPQCYFDVADELVQATNQPPRNHSVQEALQTALRDSVRHHLVADVPVGLFLSAGIDSGTLTALAAEQISGINAVTLGFSEYTGSQIDEVPLAQKLARRYECKHHISHISRQDFDEALPRILADMDQPSIDGVNTWFVAQAAANAGLKVALSGLGGDELLGGYPGFRQIPKLVACARIPAALPGFSKGFRLLSAPLIKRMTSPKYAGLFEYGDSYGGAYLLRRSLFMPWELPKILNPDLVREGWETLQPVVCMDDMVAHLPTTYAKISALELTHYMRNTLLRDSDWAGMAHSLEIRTPLVDVGLFRALAPYLVGAETAPSKRDMAQSPASPLPDAIVNRPKTGFSIPMQAWIESAGLSNQTRGLRGWAMHVYDTFETPAYHSNDRRKRVLALVSDAFGSGGGIAKFNRDLLTAVSASPAVSSVVAVTRVQPKPAQNLPIKLHYDARGIGMDSHCISGKINYIRELWRVLHDYKKIDLIICGLIGMVPAAYLIARIKRAPFCCIIHGVDAWQPDHSRLVNRLIRGANYVIAVSEYTKQRFTEWSGFDSGKVLILPNCYDPLRYGCGPKPDYLLRRYRLQGKTVLMTLGRLVSKERYKGFDEVMESLPALAKQIPNISYLIAGDGDDKQRLQEKAELLGVAELVVFAGYIPEQEKADHYRLADAYVMPGRGEGFGIVYLEAMACCIPTVGSKLDGSRDALRDGQLGVLADPTDLQDIQRAILLALAQGRGKIPEGLDFFSIGNYRQRVVELLKCIFGGLDIDSGIDR